jgi:hypothetical protein
MFWIKLWCEFLYNFVSNDTYCSKNLKFLENELWNELLRFSAAKKRKEKKEDVCLLIKSEPMARLNLESNYDCLENDEKWIMVLSEFMRL